MIVLKSIEEVDPEVDFFGRMEISCSQFPKATYLRCDIHPWCQRLLHWHQTFLDVQKYMIDLSTK